LHSSAIPTSIDVRSDRHPYSIQWTLSLIESRQSLPIDREAALKKAEKLLRQGKLDGAIAEYVRLIEDQPKDWNSINALGDLYARAGQIENASAQFVRIADHLYGEGFMPKAAALYKKSLKIRQDDEHTLMRLADISTRQGVFVDAKTYYRQIADRRRKKGDQRGADEIVVRIGGVDPSDAEAKMQGARAAKSLDDLQRASELFTEAADAYEKQKRGPEALAALSEALALVPDDATLRGRVLKGMIAQDQIDEATAIARTSAELLTIAGILEQQDKKDAALGVMIRAAQIDAGNVELRARVVRELVAAGKPDEARQFLTADTVGDDPELLMALARMELVSGRIDEGKAALNRLLAVRPDRRDELVFVGCELADQGLAEAAFACVDLVADSALLEEDWGGAAAALHEFVTRVPNQIPALMKLVEICVDGGLESTMYMAQSQLADAYLSAGLGTEARVIAEDLVAREPWVRANIERFRRALLMLGVEDPDAVIAERLSGDSPFLSTIDLPDEPHGQAAPGDEMPGTAAPGAAAPGTAAPGTMPPDTVAIEAIRIDLPDLSELPSLQDIEFESPPSHEGMEVDLSDAMSGVEGGREAPGLQDVFDGMRTQAGRESQLQDAQARYAAAIDHANHGRLDQAVTAFEDAARVPLLRFQAGTRLGRLHIARGDLVKGVEWLERATQAPAPAPEEGYAVMYELADALEHLGEHARALAVLLELAADAGEYRDIPVRIDRLSKVQTRG
jgi:tetratricopeptide (TPR) repeat protein